MNMMQTTYGKTHNHLPCLSSKVQPKQLSQGRNSSPAWATLQQRWLNPTQPQSVSKKINKKPQNVSMVSKHDKGWLYLHITACYCWKSLKVWSPQVALDSARLVLWHPPQNPIYLEGSKGLWHQLWVFEFWKLQISWPTSTMIRVFYSKDFQG